jgi:alpha-tubulin suppressor-like RCC1 family protein
MDRRLLALGSLALIACTPRASADLQHPSTAKPKVRSPDKAAAATSEQSDKPRWVDLSIESEFGCAVERTGSLYCWGRGPAAEMKLRPLPDQPPASPRNYGVRKWGPASRVELIHDARKVSTSTSLVCVIVEDGRVRCMGSFRWGSQHVYDVPGITGAVELEIAEGEACALLETGALWCWSAEDFGVPRPRFEGAIAMTVSDSLACALGRQGDVVCWGRSIEDWHRYDTHFNQPQSPPTAMGLQELENQRFPDTLEIGRFRGAVDLAITNWNSLCVLRGDGRVLCSERDLLAVIRKEDIGMREIAGAQAIASLSSTRSHICGRTTDERAQCWGRNVYGQLGDGSSLTREQAAAPVTELEGVTALAVAEDFSCALTQGRIACWGFDRGEALGREDVHAHTLEDLTAGSLVAAGRTTCATDQAQAIRCWGADMLDAIGIAGAAQPTLIGVPPGGELRGLSPGWETCFFMSTGSLHCGTWGGGWGSAQPTFNATTTTPDVHAFATSNPPTCTITGTGSKATLNCGPMLAQLEPDRQLKAPFAISTSNMRGCAAHGAGKVSCFGELYYWNDVRPPREFKHIPGISDAIALTSAGSYDCALRKSGRVSCWVGRVESEWSDDGRTPKGVHYRGGTPADMGLEQIVALTSGTQHLCALSRSGTVRCWDDNPYNEQTTWLPVPELADIVEIAAGSEHTCARSKAGKVTCWGDDVSGQLGRVPTRVYLTPTTLPVE